MSISSQRLRHINNWLTVVVIVLALYIIVLPVWPMITWWAKHDAPVVSKAATVSVPKANTPAAPKDNELIIPDMGLTEVIHEGPTAHTLHFGVWHLPGTSSPDKGGNMVMAGHRYTYSGSGVFYHLDVVKAGDPITVFWQQKRYDYTVRQVEIVPPTDVAVQAPTKDAQLTVYTCTPLWTFTNRLVVIATPKDNS